MFGGISGCIVVLQLPSIRVEHVSIGKKALIEDGSVQLVVHVGCEQLD